MARKKPAFGERRELPSTPAVERALFRLIGIADPAHWLHHRYLERALDSWADFAPATVLDAGCGRGDYALYLARRWPNARIVGIDIDQARVDRCQRLATELAIPNVEFRVGDLTMMAFHQEFDLIVSIDVLEHIERQSEALENLLTHLAPGGRFFFHVPTKRETPVILSRQLDSFREWAEHEHVAEDRTADEFSDLVERIGFSVERKTRTFGRYSGELAVSLFALPHRNTALNKVLQALLAVPCRLLAWLDVLSLDRTRYAVAVSGTR